MRIQTDSERVTASTTGPRRSALHILFGMMRRSWTSGHAQATKDSGTWPASGAALDTGSHPFWPPLSSAGKIWIRLHRAMPTAVLLSKISIDADGQDPRYEAPGIERCLVGDLGIVHYANHRLYLRLDPTYQIVFEPDDALKRRETFRLLAAFETLKPRTPLRGEIALDVTLGAKGAILSHVLVSPTDRTDGPSLVRTLMPCDEPCIPLATLALEEISALHIQGVDAYWSERTSEMDIEAQNLLDGSWMTNPRHKPTTSESAPATTAAMVADATPTRTKPAAPAKARAPEKTEPVIDGLSHIALYDLADVRRALSGMRAASDEDDAEETDYGENRNQRTLEHLETQGSAGRIRRLAKAEAGVIAALTDLGQRAPHFAQITDLVIEHARFSIHAGTPMSLPPVLIVDEPGTGKTWYLSRLAKALSLPFETLSMASMTMSEGVQGLHPSYRGAQQGLVSKLLLSEEIANPLIFVDEFDKPPTDNTWRGNPYNPYYGVLDPSNSARFLDEFLTIPFNAQNILWVLAANSDTGIPEPIRDRLTTLVIPKMTPEQRRIVARSIYADAIAKLGPWFEPVIGEDVLDRLTDQTPRQIRKILGRALVRAGADQRRALRPDDIRPTGQSTTKAYGFVRSP